MKILVVSPKDEVADAMGFLLEGQFQAEVVPVNDSKEAIQELLTEKEFHLIVIKEDPAMAVLLKYIFNSDLGMPLLVLTNKEKRDQLGPEFEALIYGTLSRSTVLDDLKTQVESAIRAGLLSESTENTAYCRIRTALLTKVTPLPGDLYVRISPKKFLRIFKKGDEFSASDLERFLVRKKIEALYFEKKDMASILPILGNSIAHTIKTQASSPESAGVVAGQLSDAVRELNSYLGFTPEVQAIAKEGVKLTLKSIGASPKLGKVLQNLRKAGGDYISSHSLYLANVACCFSLVMDWPSGTTFQKLAHAAFFHDIVLHSHHLAQMQTLAELAKNQNQFSAREIEIYKRHPLFVAELLRRYPEIPPDVEAIILQHHERPDGSGFPRGIKAHQFTPLGALFVIAHDYVSFMYKNRMATVEEFFEFHAPFYTSGHFKKIFEILIKSKEKLGLEKLK